MLENRAALLYNLLNLFCMQFSSLHAQTVSAAAFSIAFPKLGICFTSADSHTPLYGSSACHAAEVATEFVQADC